MWPFSTKTKIAKTGLFEGLTDWHSHILPGVDDGIETMEESLAVLDKYGELGVAHLWLTPHIMEDTPNEPEKLRERFQELCEAYDGPVHLHLAAENMLDNLFEKRLKQNDLLPIGEKADHLLIETSYYTGPADLYAKIDRVRKAGLFPLLAHPERYMYMELDDYDTLHENGVKMQLNLSSLFGFYGEVPLKKAQYMLRNGFYNVMGTDTHRLSQVLTTIDHGKLSKTDLGLLRTLPGL